METKFYKIKGTLERASRSDFYDNQGYFLEGKLFFQKDYWSQKIETIYTCPDDYPLATKSKDYFILKNHLTKTIDDLLQHGLLFKLSSLHREVDFHFNLFIKSANFEDFFWKENQLKINTCFYTMINNIYDGPKFINEFDDPEKILNRINQGTIYVLTKKQTFEPITISKAS